MFQNYALFPNMTVQQNIRAGARREKDARKRDHMVRTVLENIGLAELENRYSHQLSGGQQQRVALVRILVSSPRICCWTSLFRRWTAICGSSWNGRSAM